MFYLIPHIKSAYQIRSYVRNVDIYLGSAINLANFVFQLFHDFPWFDNKFSKLG